MASKATGFPIAKIATKLALGYADEIQNDITQSTPASLSRTIDYVVTKVPRFAFEKFPGADPTLTTSMKSVGEAMALAGNFQESLGKAMRSIDKAPIMGFNWDGDKPSEDEVSVLDTKSRCHDRAPLSARFSVPCGKAPPPRAL